MSAIRMLHGSPFESRWGFMSGDQRVARVEAFRELAAGFPDERAYLRNVFRPLARVWRIRRKAVAYICAKRGIA